MRSGVVSGLLLFVAVTGCVPSAETPRRNARSQTTAAGQPATRDSSSHPAPDNTGVNRRDQDGTNKTPLDQSNEQGDLDISAKIRQRVVDLPGLSVNARNVKIITADGKVTLRGPVANDEERASIEKIAIDVAGRENVANQIEVAAK